MKAAQIATALEVAGIMKIPTWGRRMLGMEPQAQSGSVLTAWPDAWMGAETLAGVPINEETAMRIAAVNGAVKIIAGAIATMPLILYKRVGEEGRERARENPIYSVVTQKPHPQWNFFEWMETEMTRLLLNGNSYSLKQPTGDGGVQLRPLDPHSVTIEVDSRGQPRYHIGAQAGQAGTGLTVGADRMFHIKALSSNGIWGRSIITDAREQMGLSQVVLEHSARMFKNGAVSRGVIEFPSGAFENTQALKKWLDSFNKEFAGSLQTGQTVVLEHGGKFNTTSLNMIDAATLDVANWSVADIARMFQIPLHMLAVMMSQPRANMEQSEKEFDKQTLLTWTRRIEYAFNDQILNSDPDHFVEFLFEERLRTDLKTRIEAYTRMVQWGLMSADEVRNRENLGPLPNDAGETYWFPLNMGPVPGTGRGAGQGQFPPLQPRQQRVNGEAAT